MGADKPHFIARKIQDHLKQQSSRDSPYYCHLCDADVPILNETRLHDHAVKCHSDEAIFPRSSEGWTNFATMSSNKAKQKKAHKTTEAPATADSKLSSNDSMQPNVGDDLKQISTLNRPVSAPGVHRPSEKNIEDITNLSLNPNKFLSNLGNPDEQHTPPIKMNPLKRAAVIESGLVAQAIENIDSHEPSRSRRAKTLSGDGGIRKDPDFSRERNAPHVRLFDPNTDRTTIGSGPRKLGKADVSVPSPRRVYDARAHVFRSKKDNFDDKITKSPFNMERTSARPVPSQEKINQQEMFEDAESDGYNDPDPELLLQPETRPISHEQLVVEVKGIYAGLVMVEAKCIDVDDKQSIAAQEKDPAKQTKLTPEQWQALIALHKTLLHEHHDFFLASQHPSAGPALSQLAAKYSMPARMWRHGIHAFLEVLRHRLPYSLDHMLAFIIIAYSMMALLYETVPTFEDTWIECLGDLGRYRMAIEDDDIKDREVWSGVARFWYAKAADKNPNVGRLYHHLAILSRPYSLQQLSLYTRSLTCIVPFGSARSSIMTLFNPILEGRESAYHKSTSMETVFIKAHGLLYLGRPAEDFEKCVRLLLGGLLEKYIGRVTSKFKEQGVFLALSNIAALLEYGATKLKDASSSIMRLYFEEKRDQTHAASADQNNGTANASESISPNLTLREDLTSDEREVSLMAMNKALDLTFGSFAIGLQFPGDKNVYPMVHVYLVFVLSCIRVEKAVKLFEQDVPWQGLATFFNGLAKSGTKAPKASSEGFPKPDKGSGQPLPEDFVMRGQLWSEFYFPDTWFSDAAIDDEERALELPSMAAPRVERMLWLGHRIASPRQWLLFDQESSSFTVTDHVRSFPPREIRQPVPLPVVDQDSIMTDAVDEDSDMDIPDSPPAKGRQSIDSSRSDLLLAPPKDDDKDSTRKAILTKPRVILSRKTNVKDDVDMTNSNVVKCETDPPHSKPTVTRGGALPKFEDYPDKMPLEIVDSHQYSSTPGKFEVLDSLDVVDLDASTNA